MNHDSELLINEVVFYEAKNMMHQKFQRIIGYFFEDTQAYIDTIQQGIDQKDASLIVPAAHTIKSSSRQMGAIKLSEIAAILEQKAREYLKEEFDFQSMVTLTDEIQQVFPLTKHQMEQRL